MEHLTEQKPGGGRPDHDVTVLISAPDEDRKFTFPKTAKISEVLAAAVKAFGLDPNGVYTLALVDKPAEKLDPHRTLVSYKIEDGSKLLLSSKAGGV